MNTTISEELNFRELSYRWVNNANCVCVLLTTVTVCWNKVFEMNSLSNFILLNSLWAVYGRQHSVAPWFVCSHVAADVFSSNKHHVMAAAISLIFFIFSVVFWTVVAVQRPSRRLHRRDFFHPLNGTEHASPPSLTTRDRELVSVLEIRIENRIWIWDLRLRCPSLYHGLGAINNNA